MWEKGVKSLVHMSAVLVIHRLERQTTGTNGSIVFPEFQD